MKQLLFSVSAEKIHQGLASRQKKRILVKMSFFQIELEPRVTYFWWWQGRKKYEQTKAKKTSYA